MPYITLTSRKKAKTIVSPLATYTATGTGSVTSVFGRAGAVEAMVGDYTASLITYEPISGGSLAAETVQAAIEELDAEKLYGYSNASNTRIGLYALPAVTTGLHNTAGGYNALSLLITGSNNTAYGHGALQKTTGSGSTAIGYVAGINNTSGGITAVGYYSLQSNTTGVCTAMGNMSLAANTTGINSAFGHEALKWLNTGSYTVAIGTGAGCFRGTGSDALTSASQSTYLGEFTRGSANGVTNEIAVGYNTVGNGSNSITLGNTSITKTILRGKVGIGNTSPTYELDVTGNGRFTADLYIGDDIGTISFTSGFTGSGWRVETSSAGIHSLTIDNLTVRRSMTVYELIINQIRATNGAVWVSDCAKLLTVKPDQEDDYACTIDDDGGNIPLPFESGDIIRCQKWNGRDVKYYTARVSQVSSPNFTIIMLDVDSSTVPEPGDDIVRIGNSSDTDRQGSIYITASDTDAPYIDVMDGVTDESFAGHIKARLGKLTGITDPLFGALTGYGLWSENVYLTGSIKATDGQIAGWNIDSDAIYTGTKKTSAGYTTSGITIASNGSIRSKYFEIGTDGYAKFKAVDSVFRAIGQGAGDLAGTVVNTQANVVGVVEIDRIELTGSSGTANISCGGVTRLATFNISLDQTAEDFVSANYSTFLAAGVKLTNDTVYIYLESTTGQLSPGASIQTITGTLSGTKTDYQNYVAAVARIDTITLTGTSGRALVSCDGVPKYLYFDWDLETTAANFVSAYASAYSTGGVTVTSSGNDIIFTSSTAGVDFTGSTTIVNAANTLYGKIVVDGMDIWEDSQNDDAHGTININMRSYKGQIGKKRSLVIGTGTGQAIMECSGLNSYTNGEVYILAQQVGMAHIPTSSGSAKEVGYLYVDASGYIRMRMS